jgi:multisubunit Na+/H+ antiporter MnhG subunit
MSIVRINRHPTRKQLNQFGLIWLGFMTFFGAVAWFKLDMPKTATGLWVAAVVVPVIGWLLPSFMRLVFLGMSYAAWPIGFVVSHVVLALVYYLVMTPIGLAMRVVGYDPMNRRRDVSDESTWVERDSGTRGPESYFRQF